MMRRAIGSWILIGRGRDRGRHVFRPIRNRTGFRTGKELRGNFGLFTDWMKELAEKMNVHWR